MIAEMNFNAYDTIIAQRVAQLQYFQKREVLDFVNYLITKPLNQQIPINKKINFSWEGALKREFTDISSVELQHKIWEL
jgi:hypothetical protein